MLTSPVGRPRPSYPIVNVAFATEISGSFPSICVRLPTPSSLSAIRSPSVSPTKGSAKLWNSLKSGILHLPCDAQQSGSPEGTLPSRMFEVHAERADATGQPSVGWHHSEGGILEVILASSGEAHPPGMFGLLLHRDH